MIQWTGRVLLFPLLWFCLSMGIAEILQLMALVVVVDPDEDEDASYYCTTYSTLLMMPASLLCKKTMRHLIHVGLRLEKVPYECDQYSTTVLY
jgi:hypothetical protein